MQKILGIFLSALFILLLSACGGAKQKELTQLEQLQINKHYDTAKREIFIKNFAAAEQALSEITKIDDTNFSVWLDIGVLRARINKTAEARDAYKKALKWSSTAFEKDANNQTALITNLQSLILLNRAQDARDLMTKVAKKNPSNTAYQELARQNVVDVFLGDPQISGAIVK